MVNPITCDLNSIREFLFSEEKAFDTIADYKSAISEVYNPIDNHFIGFHFIISKAILVIQMIF